MKVRAVLFGATGMVGEGVLHVALGHPEVESVLVIGRRPSGLVHPNLREIVHNDFYDFSSIAGELSGYNACFFCLGVSSVGMREGEYTRVTYDLTLAAARTLASRNPDMTFCYVSGSGTDSTEHGRIMWARVKGRTENALRALPFKAVYLFRPGFIRPIAGLRNAYSLAKILGWGYPLWKAVFPSYVCTLEEVGLAMVSVALHGYEKPILENRDLSLFGPSHPTHTHEGPRT